MRLTKKAISKLKSREGLSLRNRLAFELEKSPVTIGRWIDDNANNGGLTTKKALEIIESATNLTEAQILERESATAA